MVEELSYIAFFLGDIRGKRGLEFGFNVGATAIILRCLGAEVTAVDTDRRCLAIAAANAARYGAGNIDFVWVTAGSPLPFSSENFDFVTCQSVLEYVDPPQLSRILSEIDRVLAPGGVLLVLATSNRLAPREVHSRRWLSNYIPASWDKLCGRRQRGIFPWQVTRPLRGYGDLVRADGGRSYFAARENSGDGPARIRIVRMLAVIGRLFGLSCGAVTPSFALILRKPG